MKPSKRTLMELFGEKRRYIVPLYQRKYAWNSEPNLRLLWEDVMEAVSGILTDRSKTAPHFMGAMVTVQKTTFGQAVPAFEVIDGQQRLTTIQIFLLAFRDVIASESPTYEAELNRYILNDGIMADSAQERYKLWPTITDRRQFVQLVDPSVETDGQIFDGGDENSTSGERIGLAYEFFHSRIAGYVFEEDVLDDDKTAYLFEALKDYLAVVVIELEAGDDPQTIFETLNSRGVDLTQSDLIRNMIFQRAAAEEIDGTTLVSDHLYLKYWLPLDRAFWSESESRGRQTLPRLDWMLADYLSMRQRKMISTTNLADDYRRWAKSNASYDDLEDEIRDVFETSENAMRIIAKESVDCLGVFGKVASAFDISTAHPLVLFLAEHAKDEETLKQCLEHIESYIVRRDICRLTTKNYNNVFIDVMKNINLDCGDLTSEVARVLLLGTSDTNLGPTDGLFLSKWEMEKQYRTGRQKRLVYILSKIEIALASKFSETFRVEGALTVEHIMPRSWQEHWPLDVESDPNDELDIARNAATLQREEKINSFGNLTLLTRKLNSRVSNGPFGEKLDDILSHSRLTLNLELQQNSEWNEERIADRSRAHGTIATKIWKRPVLE